MISLVAIVLASLALFVIAGPTLFPGALALFGIFGALIFIGTIPLHKKRETDPEYPIKNCSFGDAASLFNKKWVIEREYMQRHAPVSFWAHRGMEVVCVYLIVSIASVALRAVFG